MAPATPPAPDRGRRIAAIDQLRGVAIVAMVVYHTAFDLSAKGLIETDVLDSPGWRIFARLIAGTFLALVGFNLVLAEKDGFRARPFLRRLAMIAGGALLVSIATYVAMPQAFVFFGILHMIALGSVLALPFLRVPWWATAVAAIVVLALPHYVASPLFDMPALWWVGLGTRTHASIDFVPVFPWFGIVLFGVVAGRLAVDRALLPRLAAVDVPGRAGGFLSLLGRWSLLIYLLHQPLIFGATTLAARYAGPSEETLSTRFIDACFAQCRTNGGDLPVCEASCGCVLTGLRQQSLLRQGMANTMTPAETQQWLGILKSCQPQELAPLSPAN